LDKIIETVSQDIFFIHSVLGLEVENIKKEVIESLKEEDGIEFSKEDLKKLDKEISKLLKDK
jgi:hypothetical protein